MFSKLFRKKPKGIPVSHLCWMSVAEKFDALPGMIEDTPQPIWLISFFEEPYQQLKTMLEERKIPYWEGRDRGERVVLCLVDRLPHAQLDQSKVILLEPHPLYSQMEKLQSDLQSRGATQLTVLVGMDEPLMKGFDPDGRLQKVMTRMGVQPGETIEHQMISKSIERAQQKVEESLPSPCLIWTSQAEWFADNGLDTKRPD